MKLDKETKQKIDNYFDSKTPEELLYIFKKYGLEVAENLTIPVVMPEFNSLIVRLVELLCVKYPSRKVNSEFIDNLKTVWKENEVGLKDRIKALEKELNLV